jgi:hypothetical protein
MSEPLPTWDPEAFFGHFWGFQEKFYYSFVGGFVPRKHLLVINYQTFPPQFIYMTLWPNFKVMWSKMVATQNPSFFDV